MWIISHQKLVVTFYDLCERAKEDFSRVAVVTDIRGGALSDKFFEFLETFKERKVPYKILFLDAGDIVLVHRYKETRRRHPLSEAASGSLEQAVKMERELLRPMREAADYIIDTSYLAPSQLKQRLSQFISGQCFGCAYHSNYVIWLQKRNSHRGRHDV